MEDKIRDKVARLIHDNYGKMPLNRLAHQICQLFEPKLDESLLLTDEEILDAAHKGQPRVNQSLFCSMVEAGAKAQLAKDQAHEQGFSYFHKQGYRRAKITTSEDDFESVLGFLNLVIADSKLPRETLETFTSDLFGILYERNIRKVELGKLPILADEEITKYIGPTAGVSHKAVAEAQRADMLRRLEVKDEH